MIILLCQLLFFHLWPTRRWLRISHTTPNPNPNPNPHTRCLVEIFYCYFVSWECQLGVETMDPAKHSTWHRTAFHPKELPCWKHERLRLTPFAAMPLWHKTNQPTNKQASGRPFIFNKVKHQFLSPKCLVCCLIGWLLACAVVASCMSKRALLQGFPQLTPSILSPDVREEKIYITNYVTLSCDVRGNNKLSILIPQTDLAPWLGWRKYSQLLSWTSLV